MVTLTKEACQDVFVPARVYTLSGGAQGLTLADMEAIFGRLARYETGRGVSQNTLVLECEDQERTRLFNFTDIPLTKINQDGTRSVIHPRDPTLFTPFILPTRSSSANFNTEAWWTALAKTQTNPHDLLNKIVITRSRFFTGTSLHEVHQQLKYSRITPEEHQALISSQPFSAYYSGKKIVAVYAMFVYVLDIGDFKGYAHLHERTTGIFLSLKTPFLAPAHPFDVCNNIADGRASDTAGIVPPPVWVTHRLVYHEHTPRTRFINDAGCVLEIIPERDTTTQEGYYKTVVQATKVCGAPGRVERVFIEPNKLSEDAGFYFTQDAAKENLSRQDSAKLALALQSGRDALYKGWLSSMQADAKNNAQALKDATAQQLQAIRDTLTKNTETSRAQANALLKENQLLRDKLKAAAAEAEDARRVHEQNMLRRKEQLELLRLIPACLAILTTIAALTKGSKKK